MNFCAIHMHLWGHALFVSLPALLPSGQCFFSKTRLVDSIIVWFCFKGVRDVKVTSLFCLKRLIICKKNKHFVFHLVSSYLPSVVRRARGDICKVSWVFFRGIWEKIRSLFPSKLLAFQTSKILGPFVPFFLRMCIAYKCISQLHLRHARHSKMNMQTPLKNLRKEPPAISLE